MSVRSHASTWAGHRAVHTINPVMPCLTSRAPLTVRRPTSPHSVTWASAQCLPPTERLAQNKGRHHHWISTCSVSTTVVPPPLCPTSLYNTPVLSQFPASTVNYRPQCLINIILSPVVFLKNPTRRLTKLLYVKVANAVALPPRLLIRVTKLG